MVISECPLDNVEMVLFHILYVISFQNIGKKHITYQFFCVIAPVSKAFYDWQMYSTRILHNLSTHSWHDFFFENVHHLKVANFQLISQQNRHVLDRPILLLGNGLLQMKIRSCLHHKRIQKQLQDVAIILAC